MPSFTAPANDIRYLLNDWLQLAQYSDLPGFENGTSDVVDAIVAGIARLAENVTLPLNMSGDRQGCEWVLARYRVRSGR